MAPDAVPLPGRFAILPAAKVSRGMGMKAGCCVSAGGGGSLSFTGTGRGGALAASSGCFFFSVSRTFALPLSPAFSFLGAGAMVKVVGRASSTFRANSGDFDRRNNRNASRWTRIVSASAIPSPVQRERSFIRASGEEKGMRARL
jgi:hypothetical protein